MDKLTNRWKLVPSVSVEFDIGVCSCLTLGLFGLGFGVCFGVFAEQTQRGIA